MRVPERRVLKRVHRGDFAHLLVVLGVLVLASPAGAGTIGLAWHACNGPINITMFPGALPVAPVVVNGMTQGVRGYEFRVAISDANGTLPDAWRFDEGGCQGPDRGYVTWTLPDFGLRVCPPFQGPIWSTHEASLTLATPEAGLPPTTAVVRLRNTYFDIDLPRTGSRHLGLMIFDHELSVVGEAQSAQTCGGLERSMCLTLLPEHCYFVAADGQHVPFEIGNGTITANGGSCAAVPASLSTWGQIKSQYRR